MRSHSWGHISKRRSIKGFDLKGVSPNARSEEDTRTPAELLDLIEAKAREVAEALAKLRR